MFGPPRIPVAALRQAASISTSAVDYLALSSNLQMREEKPFLRLLLSASCAVFESSKVDGRK